MKFNYNNKKFRAVLNSDNGDVSMDMVFHYHQTGNILTCQYFGGKIKLGQLIGLVDEAGTIDMHYHQITHNNEIMTGVCTSTPQLLNNGKIRLIEHWQWTSGDKSIGQSVLEEV
ncbi:MAG: n-acetylglutamate synthase [Winogradskyella sp.]|uniref:n-acetylglutamate synthase n=1 Tax=Winogradskyella sp. TaxID=1883156 RepID=UPI0025D7363C|nr:n-acetylglutamate synthase [Winogradskyella sp.]NRB61036.1 n-acetylglutamate synthase [Winogradskyella sp.]